MAGPLAAVGVEPGEVAVESLDGWLPIRMGWRGPEPYLDWAFFGEHRLAEPFFEQSVEVCLCEPGRPACRRTGIAVLGERHAARPGLDPSGFVFHMSRCGSTLVSRLLAALPQNVVLSEADPIHAVLRARLHEPRLDEATLERWLRWMVSALGQRRCGAEKHLVIKLDSWGALDLELIQRVFPDVPWIFLYREPLEVMVSHARRRGTHPVPVSDGARRLSLEPAAVERMAVEEYRARVLARICRAALDALRPHGSLLLDYRRLPEAVWTTVLGLFGIDHASADVERLRRLARFDAKSPGRPFVADGEAKRREATPEVLAAVERWLRPIYGELEARALAGGG